MNKNHGILYKYGRRGVSTMEYGLLAALIGLVVLVGVTMLGRNASSMYCTVSAALGQSTPVGCSTSSSASASTNLPIVFTPNDTTVLPSSNIITLVNDMLEYNASGIEGMYDQYGHEYSTPQEYLYKEGVTPSDYAALVKQYNVLIGDMKTWQEAGEPSTGEAYDTFMKNDSIFAAQESAIQAKLPSSTANGADDVFVPDLHKLALLDSSGNIIISN